MIEPRFISFEGGEGAGKSTQVSNLAKAFKKQNIPVVTSREPGGSPGAEEIRDLLVSGSPSRWHPKTELLLNYAARIEHVSRLLKPAIDQGIWAITDRFFDSTFAYQGFGHGIDLSELETIHSISLEKFKPDLSILLDLSVSEGLSRAKRRDNLENRYEKMNKEFHERVRQGFLKLSAAEPDRFVVIDASQPIDKISEQVREFINQKFELSLN